ncbi:hypothetical protein JHK85_054603 [Glycine max]|nr:hypothetical protein JHK85_054603 [Glycine max]
MNTRRDNRNNRVSLFDGIEEGGIRASSVYSSSHEIDEHDNEQALDGLQDRVNLLKRRQREHGSVSKQDIIPTLDHIGVNFKVE